MPYGDPAAQRNFQREWIAKRRALYTDGVPCARCGANAEEWHHRDPAQKLDHRIWSWSITRLEAELLKCEALCTGCHRQVHHAAHGHGDIRRYWRGCRCNDCRAAENDYQRRQRAARRAASKAAI